MNERHQPPTLVDLKAKYFQHILAVSPTQDPTLRSRPTGCTCLFSEVGEEPGTTTVDTFATAAVAPCASDVLAEEAVEMLSPGEKDEIILQMHAKIRSLFAIRKAKDAARPAGINKNGRVEEVIALSERTVYSQERAHEEALREQRASEQRLRRELSQWKHCHPVVTELLEENARLREEAHLGRRQYLAALGKLARRQELLETRR